MAKAQYPTEIPGPGLVLRPWDMGLASQMAQWSPRGFPYHAFDLSHLRDPVKQAAAVASCTEEGRHRHFVAVEGETAVGRASVNLRDPLGTYIWSVHVPPEHEGRGVARRMLATLMTYLEVSNPGASFVLTTNAYAEAAHRVYRALGFVTTETLWHFDREIAEALWRVTPKEREPVNRFIRFQSGRWQVRSHVMRRTPGTAMDLGAWGAVASQGSHAGLTPGPSPDSCLAGEGSLDAAMDRVLGKRLRRQ